MATTIEQQLTNLDNIRDQLADNLAAMGVTASNTETLKKLVPKVVDIIVGDTSAPLFDFTLLKSSISKNMYGSFKFKGCASVTRCCLITRIDLVVTATEPLTLLVSGADWSPKDGSSDKEAIARCNLTRANPVKAQRALDGLAFSVQGGGTVEVTVKGYYNNQVFTPLGSTKSIKLNL